MNVPLDFFLRQFFTALIESRDSEARAALSPRFEWEEGLDVESYLSHEFRMFAELRPLYDLDRHFHLRLSTQPSPSDRILLEVEFFNSNSQFVYEWLYVLDLDGRLMGNGSRCQTVSKRQHSSNGSWWALAIQCDEAVIDVRPLFSHSNIRRTDLSPDGRFWNLSFSTPDDGHSFYGDFRIRYAKRVEIKRIWIRGEDRPQFSRNAPMLGTDRRTLTHPAALPWSLAFRLDDGTEGYLPFPRTDSFQFDSPVAWACLTDALDHDWIFSHVDA
jgi:hypothetical protein